MWARLWRESPREAHLDHVSGVLRVGWRSRVALVGVVVLLGCVGRLAVVRHCY